MKHVSKFTPTGVTVRLAPVLEDWRKYMKLYIVTADTYTDSYGADIELLRVADNEADANESVEYAKSQGWHANINTIEMNKPTRKYLGGYIE